MNVDCSSVDNSKTDTKVPQGSTTIKPILQNVDEAGNYYKLHNRKIYVHYK